MSYEKVISWMWRENKQSPRREDAYYFDPENKKIIITRGKQLPKDSKEVVCAVEAMESYKIRGYKNLTEHSQIMYDYLKAKGY